MSSRHTVILVPTPEGFAVSVPSMPGCGSQGGTREEALSRVLDAMLGWMLTEAEQGRAPLAETPKVVAESVSEALEIIQEMREAGEIAPEPGFQLELAPVDLQSPVVASPAVRT